MNNARHKNWMKRAVITATMLAVFVSSAAHISMAQDQDAGCLPGIPCVVDKTENDPAAPDNGPNAGPNADKNTSGACDADFMNQIYSRAYIEAEREIVMNEIVIRKPDSVLEYTCFDQIAGINATVGSALFSGSDNFTDKTVPIEVSGSTDFLGTEVTISNTLGPDSLGDVLENLVLASLINYRNNNFAHDFLGGYATNQNSEFSAEATAEDYNCGVMNAIYTGLAKCMDFATDDRFFSFETLANLDPRLLPAQCAADDEGTAITQDLINVANNTAFQYVNFDETDTHLDWVIGGAEACSIDPIPTGILTTRLIFSFSLPFGDVKIERRREYDEGICPPGCLLNDDGTSCGGN